jgi:hypothetical protein
VNDRRVYTLTFFERKSFADANATVAADRFVATGETQVITISFVNSVIPVITSETLAASFTDQLRLTVTSDLAGTVYAVAVIGDASPEVVAPTAQQIIAQANYGTGPIVLQGTGTGSVAASTATIIYLAGTGVAAGEVVDVYYVVVGETSISSVKKVNNLTIAAASAASGSMVVSTGEVISGVTAPAGHVEWVYARAANGTIGTIRTVLAKVVLGSTTLAELGANTRLGAANTLATAAGVVTFVDIPDLTAAITALEEDDELVLLSVGANDVILAWAAKEVDLTAN